MIRLENICFSYEESEALKDISLHIEKGQTVILEGPNGCGKSTLLKIMNGLIFPSKGKYYFEGEEITHKKMQNNVFAKKFHQKLGFVFQNSDVQLFCGNVEDEIGFGPRQMGLTEEEVHKRVEDCLDLLDIQKLRKRPPYHLSGGEKKKVAIACILSMNPEVLILDEPLNGLDRESRKWLLDFLKQLKSSGKTMIIATHDEELKQELKDVVFTM
ncbi:MAG: energy-coupling factor ABC transporter ATP-binding protein [Lachnospiraceae bacterium]|nr:energy-coupling factor ABC transporter ATP-binding protein [Lachnospiraceae bacterium]